MDLPAILARKPEVVLVDELAHTNVPGAENAEALPGRRGPARRRHLGHDGRQHPALRVRPGHRLARDRRRRPGARARPAPAPGRRGRQRGPAVRGAARAAAGRQDLPGRAHRPGARELLHRGEPRVAARARDAPDRRPARGRAPRHATVDRRAEPVGTKAMVAMSSNPETTRRLLRRASALAGKLNTNWFAVYVRTPRDSPQRMSAREHRLLSENVTLAMELGAKVVWLSAEDVAGELLRFAREHGVTLAIFGKSRRPAWLRLRPQEPDRGLRRALGTGIDVYEIETEETERDPPAARPAPNAAARSARACARAVVPQQPPTMRAPRASQRAGVLARSPPGESSSVKRQPVARRPAGPGCRRPTSGTPGAAAASRREVPGEPRGGDAVDSDRVGRERQRARRAASSIGLAREQPAGAVRHERDDDRQRRSPSRPTAPRRPPRGSSCASRRGSGPRRPRRGTAPARRARARAPRRRERDRAGSSPRAARASPPRRLRARDRGRAWCASCDRQRRQLPRARRRGPPSPSERACVRNVLAVRMSAPAATSSPWIGPDELGVLDQRPARSRAAASCPRRAAGARCPSPRRAGAAARRGAARETAWRERPSIPEYSRAVMAKKIRPELPLALLNSDQDTRTAASVRLEVLLDLPGLHPRDVLGPLAALGLEEVREDVLAERLGHDLVLLEVVAAPRRGWPAAGRSAGAASRARSS